VAGPDLEGGQVAAPSSYVTFACHVTSVSYSYDEGVLSEVPVWGTGFSNDGESDPCRCAVGLGAVVTTLLQVRKTTMANPLAATKAPESGSGTHFSRSAVPGRNALPQTRASRTRKPAMAVRVLGQGVGEDCQEVGSDGSHPALEPQAVHALRVKIFSES